MKSHSLSTLARSATIWVIAAVLSGQNIRALADTMIVGLTPNNSLVTFTADGGPVSNGPAITGLGAGELVVGIDFRPFTGQLYALARDTANVGHLYTVDAATGVASAVPLSGAVVTITGSVDIDFNPAAMNGTNALRIVTSDRQDYRLFFNDAGAMVNVDGALNAAGAGTVSVFATAYSNNRSGLPGAGGGTTIQYAIDSGLDVLYRVNPPNNGTLTDPKPLGIDVSATGGLDITTDGDRALAIFTVAGNAGLYEVSLANGTATLVRNLPANVIDLAVPVPIRAQMQSGNGTSLSMSGGIGPFAVQRAEVVNDPFCSIGTSVQRTVAIVNEGNRGFMRMVDLAGTPPVRLTVSLSGAAERPTPVTTTADGFGTLEISGNTLSFNIGYRGLSGAAIAAHIHGPADSATATGVMINLAPFNGGAFGTSGTLIGSVSIDAAQKAAILGGLTYVNVHTPANGGGEIRGQVVPAVYQAVLSGAAERPNPNSTEGTGFGLFTIVGRELAFDVSYRGLTGPAIAAHFHGPALSSAAAGVMIDIVPFSAGPLGTSGRFTGKVTLTADQLAVFSDSKTYVNIHTAANGGGEIRGQVRPVISALPFSAEMTGAAERPNPVTNTSGSGFASVQLSGDNLTFQVSYRGMSGPIIAAHFHGPAPASGAAGVQINIVPFHRGPLAAEGLFVGSVTLTSEQKAMLLAGDVYVNLHTVANGGGEIRGQVVPVVLQATMNGAAERPNPTDSTGAAYGYLTVLGKQLSLGLRYGGLTGPAVAAHIHGPATADVATGVLIDIASLASGGLAAEGFFQGTVALNDANLASVADGLTYVNIHTVKFGGGEIRGQVVP